MLVHVLNRSKENYVRDIKENRKLERKRNSGMEGTKNGSN